MVTKIQRIKCVVLIKARLLSLNGKGETAREISNYLNENNFGFKNGITPQMVGNIIKTHSKIPHDILSCIQTEKVSNNNQLIYSIPKGAK